MDPEALGRMARMVFQKVPPMPDDEDSEKRPFLFAAGIAILAAAGAEMGQEPDATYDVSVRGQKGRFRMLLAGDFRGLGVPSPEPRTEIVPRSEFTLTAEEEALPLWTDLTDKTLGMAVLDTAFNGILQSVHAGAPDPVEAACTVMALAMRGFDHNEADHIRRFELDIPAGAFVFGGRAMGAVRAELADREVVGDPEREEDGPVLG
jgi:hypothetical protein